MGYRVALISGGSRGLGASIARACLHAGYAVAAFSRTSGPFVDEQSEKDPDGARFYWAAVDAQDGAALKRFVDAVAERWGGVDALVNNAAVGRFGAFALMRLQEIDETVQLNLRANLVLTRLCVPTMISRGGGCILNISSVNAVRGNAGVAVYSATKAALDGFTRALARELGPSNIRVNSLAPGYFQSEMVAGLSERQLRTLVRSTPLGRLGTADEIAEAALFLLSSAAGFITGQTLVVDGGITC